MKLGMTIFATLLILSGTAITGERTIAQEHRDAVNRIAPQVHQMMQTMTSDAMISVIVELKEKEDLRDIKDPERPKRLRKVIDRLQQKSALTQRRIQALLRKQARQGQVASFNGYWVFNGLEVTATAAAIQELATLPEVAQIIPNGAVQAPALPVSNNPPEANLAAVNAPALWNLGWQGQGIVIANMDTGVDGTHPDLAAKWRGGTNSWFDPYGQHPSSPVDIAGASSGHGTWTMGVMVGGDAGGTSIGMAPNAQWIAVKIFNDQGTGTLASIHAAFQWLLDPDGNPTTADAPHVVNNSWTLQTPGCNLEFAADLQALRAAGILPIFAAGNGGPNADSSYSPANNPGAFAVGGINNSDALYAYSSRGPTTCNGLTIFPQLVAPGVNIRSSDLFSLYTNSTGTSLAAPHVSGALALLLSAFPELNATQQETALLNSAIDLGALGVDNDFGYGRLDVLNAYQWLVTTNGNQPPTVNASQDQTITLPAAALLTGAASDDGLPAPATLTTTWRMISGPGTVTFGDLHTAQTTATFSTEGTYILRLTAEDGQLTTSDEVMIVVNPITPPNQPPTANAGLDQTITLPAPAQLNGMATDDGLPVPTVLVTTWSMISGLGTVTFADPQGLQTIASFSAAGSYTLRITVSDGQFSTSDEVVVTVNPQPNQPPTVNAGPDQAITLPATAQLGGTVSDDGLPAPATLTTTWRMSSGPGVVTFDHLEALQTIATFSTAGSYTLRLTTSDGQLTASDEVVITVNPQPASANILYVSASANGKVGGLSFQDEDIVAFNPATGRWSLVFDGSDVGLGNSDIDAFDILADGSLLLSLDGSLPLSGLGAVKDVDILRFTPTVLGNTTAGAFAFYLRGADVGLTTSDEDIDAISLLSDGRLLFSTLGNVSMPGVSGADEDLIALNLSTRVATLYFDGSKVGLTASSEDLWGVWVDNTGKLNLSTQGAFAVTGVSGSGSDIFICNLLTTGVSTTSCTFSAYWQGATYGLTKIIDGISIGGNLPLFTPTTKGRAAEASEEANMAADDQGQSNVDDDPLNGDMDNGEAEPVSEENNMQLIFLPLITQ